MVVDELYLAPLMVTSAPTDVIATSLSDSVPGSPGLQATTSTEADEWGNEQPSNEIDPVPFDTHFEFQLSHSHLS